MELQGKIIEIGTTQAFGTGDFTKRMLVVETEDQYPQTLGIEFIKDKTVILDKYAVGDKVIVGVNLRGRSYEDKDFNTQYITSLQGWRIVKDGATG